jgi:hypothetical protein
MPFQVSPLDVHSNFLRLRGSVQQDGGFLALTNLPRHRILYRDRRRVRDDIGRHYVLPDSMKLNTSLFFQSLLNKAPPERRFPSED